MAKKPASEFGGTGVEVSTVFARGKRSMSASDQARLLKSTGGVDPTRKMDPRIFGGEMT